MPTETLIASLTLGKAAVRTTLRTFSVLIQKATAKKEGAKQINYVADGDPPPAAANAWVQIWELALFEKHGHRSDSKKSDSPKPTKNSLCVEIPGFVQQVGSGASSKYEFRVLGSPTLGSGDAMGWLRIALKGADGQPWQQDGKDLVVPIIGSSEDEVDLGATIEDSAGTKKHESGPFDKGSMVQCTNMTHIIGTMIDEGGLTCAFYADLNTPEDKEDLRKFQQQLRNKEVTTAEMPTAMTRDGKKHLYGESGEAVNNNEVFPNAGERFARSYHSVGLKSGELANVTTPMKSGMGAVISDIANMRDKVFKEYLGEKGDKPKISRLVFFAHGDKKGGLLCGPGQWTGHGSLDSFPPKLAEHLTKDCVVTLFACWTARGVSDDVGFGEAPAPGQPYVGATSWAGKLWKALHDAGLADVAVWGHTIFGHSTSNPCLRAFHANGAVDIVWMKEKPGNRGHQAVDFQRKNKPKDSDDIEAPIVHAAILHPGDVIKRVVSDAYPSGGGQ